MRTVGAGIADPMEASAVLEQAGLAGSYDAAQAVRARLKELGVTEADVADAVA